MGASYRGAAFPSKAIARDGATVVPEDMETQVVVLCGGVGGARFLDGLAQNLPPHRLTAVVNTGDDFEHWGLWISPDLDTCMYTLAGLAPVERGWGLIEESFHCFQTQAKLGAETWFQLGDRDLAVHLRRTELMRQGQTLTDVTNTVATALGVDVPLLPMADTPRQTFIETVDHGTLPFQEWLVQHRGTPRVKAVHSRGEPTPSSAALAAIVRADLLVIAPSNPYVSIDPILKLEGVRQAIGDKPVVAVSPIIGGRAVKGPLGTMIPDIAGVAPSAQACRAHYRQALPSAALAFVAEIGDAVTGEVEGDVMHSRILMTDRASRAGLAKEVLYFAQAWSGQSVALTPP